MFSFCRNKSAEKDSYTPSDVEPGDINSYIEKRLNAQIRWYSKKSREAQKNYKRLQVIELVLAALIPLLSSYTVGRPRVAFFVGVLGAIVAIIESLERLFRYHENWIEYRSICEMLKREKHLYLMNASPYGADETREQLFVRNVESLISAETSKWTSTNTNIILEKSKNHSETGV